MSTPRHLVLLGLLLSAPVLAQHAPVVIANKSVSIDRIDTGQATQIFLKQIQTWPDGVPIEPVDIKEGSPLRIDFYAKVTGRSAGQLRAYWARQSFTGMGFPPREVATAEDVTRAVQAKRGAVGYIDRKDVDESTKVLLDTQ
jgi:ABC-type phosphate transport system substrate-binding protein